MKGEWRPDPEVGKEAVMKYFDIKGGAIRRSGAFPRCTLVKLVRCMNPVRVEDLLVNDEETSGRVCIYYEEGR
ncbi:MAG: hypothetical protein MJ161_05270 [Clostridia bacterium]|nr:hypothetical protein [Clostridia bacterium]